MHGQLDVKYQNFLVDTEEESGEKRKKKRLPYMRVRRIAKSDF